MAARRCRTAGGAARAMDERRLHPRRDEHRQHEHRRRDHRLRALRLHGSLPPRHGIQFDRRAAGAMPMPTSPSSHNGTWRASPRPSCRCWPMTRTRPWTSPATSCPASAASYRRHWLAGVRAKLGLAGAQARADGRRGPTPRWPRTGCRCCRPASGFHAGLAQAGRCRRRPARPCASCFPTRRRWMPGSRAGKRAPKPKRVPAAQRTQAMRRVNPRIIPRNHCVEEALDAASGAGDLRPFENLLQAIKRPCDDGPRARALCRTPRRRAYTDGYRTFCGT
jgi:hypothetical protein